MELSDFTPRPPRHCEMSIKVCGMANPDNIRQVASLTPMLMGFIFYDKTPRSAIGLDPEVVKTLPDFIRPVAVFVNAPTHEITETATRYGIRIIQLHGSESPDQCAELRAMGYTVFKAVGINDEFDFETLRPYVGSVDLFLMDNKTPTHGGSGQKFHWDVLERYTLPVPYLLSGGIGPDDVDAIVAAMRPGMAGIDINSRFESSPGVKQLGTLANFILSLRKFNEDEPTSTPIWEKR